MYIDRPLKMCVPDPLVTNRLAWTLDAARIAARTAPTETGWQEHQAFAAQPSYRMNYRVVPHRVAELHVVPHQKPALSEGARKVPHDQQSSQADPPKLASAPVAPGCELRGCPHTQTIANARTSASEFSRSGHRSGSFCSPSSYPIPYFIRSPPFYSRVLRALHRTSGRIRYS